MQHHAESCVRDVLRFLPSGMCSMVVFHQAGSYTGESTPKPKQEGDNTATKRELQRSLARSSARLQRVCPFLLAVDVISTVVCLGFSLECLRFRLALGSSLRLLVFDKEIR